MASRSSLMRRASEGWTLIAVVVAAIGLWLSSGAMAFVSGDVHGTRVGVLPSPWWLVAALAISALAAIALHLLGQPATALWLAAVLIVPWLPVPLPAAAFIWSGPLRMWIAALIVFAALAPIVAASARSGRLVVLMDPRRAPRIAAAIAAVLYVVTAWRIMPRLPGGDEPHYLMIAESLLRDGDLKIENNHLRGDYRDFVDVPLKPDYLRRGTNGEIYSIHAPGLPAVVAPVFALFGYPGVLVFLALVSAAATGVAWSTVWRITGDAAAGWFGWATVALSLPYLFQSFTAYPDGLGGALVMFGVFIAILGSGGSTRLLIAASAALALLPWLHTRFALTACALAVVIAARQWDAPDRLRRLVAFATIPLVGAVAWFGFFYVIYGTPNPAAPYNGNTQSGLGNIPRGVTGLLFDQQFGLLANAPVYACAVAGFLPLGRRHPRIAAELAFVIVPYTLAAAAFYMWWGGFSAPARFISSILLPLSIPAGAWFATRGTAAKICAIGVLAISVLFTVTTAVVDRGALLYNVRDGSSLLLSWLVPMVDVPTGMPSLFQTGAVQAAIRAVVWLLAFAAAAGLVATIVARTRVTRAVIPIAAAFAAAAAAMLALSVVWRLNAAQPLTQGEAGPAVLRAIDGDARQIALQYRPFARLRAGAVPPLLPLLAPPVATPRADPPLASVSDAPAATYTIEATLTGDARRIGAGLDLLPAPMWTWDVSGIRGPWRETVTLPNDAHVFRVDADAPSGAVQNLSIRAERRLASHERVTNRPGWRAARYGRATVFLLDGRAWIETGGSWIVGASYAEFAVVRDSGAPLQLFVRNAAVENIVTLDADAWHETLTLKPREERTLTIPIVPQRPGVVLRVAASTGTRPADVEEGNRDKRFLGCWIETR